MHRHPWNTDFTWRRADTTPRRLSPDQIDHRAVSALPEIADICHDLVGADVRRTNIVQYAPEGAEVLAGDPALGAATGRVRQRDPDRQYEVVRNGERVRLS